MSSQKSQTEWCSNLHTVSTVVVDRENARTHTNSSSAVESALSVSRVSITLDRVCGCLRKKAKRALNFPSSTTRCLDLDLECNSIFACRAIIGYEWQTTAHFLTYPVFSEIRYSPAERAVLAWGLPLNVCTFQK